MYTHPSTRAELWQAQKGLAISKAMTLLKRYGMYNKDLVPDVIADIHAAFMTADAEQFALIHTNLPYQMARLAGQAVNHHRRSVQQSFDASLVQEEDSRASLAASPYESVYEQAAAHDECDQVLDQVNQLDPRDRLIFTVNQVMHNGGTAPEYLGRVNLGAQARNFARLCKIVARLEGRRFKRWESLTRRVHHTIRSLIMQRRDLMARSLARVIPAFVALMTFVLPVAEAVAKVH